eukprot:TRINITY_DN5012_c0_g1_i2.p1 TRINITY_DN5012_c0_g1~~TRINITY_DN5012_c0_g1_i2.p1  ORF type:complete len:951 (-),score=112.95 TRINITY_DN5012_c0_g1_i2:45-2897(-)
MFYHAYNNYMQHAFPADELKPLSCKPRDRLPAHHPDNRGTLDECMGGYSLTLVDTLDSLVILGDLPEFSRAVGLVTSVVSFDKDVDVNLFEITIRMLGGLLSAHVLAVKYLNDTYPPMEGSSLLDLAVDLGNRLLPAFHTHSKIPYSRVNLRYGVPRGEPPVNCLAGAGTLLLEFGALSRLSGNPVYETVAGQAMKALWEMRSPNTNLICGMFDIHAGRCIGDLSSGIGAGSDSYYEYLLKSYILFGDTDYLYMFNKSYDAIQKYIKHGTWYLDVNMHSGTVHDYKITSLQAFWPALLVLSGDIPNAIEMHSTFYGLWRRYKFLPENFNVKKKSLARGHSSGYPLRPEFIESTFLLYRATHDPHYLEVGEHVLRNLQSTRVACGYAAVADVETARLEDRMDSFFLSETCKYLFLLFDEENELANSLEFLFSTEGHLLPIYPPKMGSSNARTPDEPPKSPRRRSELKSKPTAHESQIKSVQSSFHDTEKLQKRETDISSARCKSVPPANPATEGFMQVCTPHAREEIIEDVLHEAPEDDSPVQMFNIVQQSSGVFNVDAWGTNILVYNTEAIPKTTLHLVVYDPTAEHTSDSSSEQEDTELSNEDPASEPAAHAGDDILVYYTHDQLQNLRKWKLRRLAAKWLASQGKSKHDTKQMREKEDLVDFIERAQQQQQKIDSGGDQTWNCKDGECSASRPPAAEERTNSLSSPSLSTSAKFELQPAHFGAPFDSLKEGSYQIGQVDSLMCNQESVDKLLSVAGEYIRGRIVLVDRGSCPFIQKVAALGSLGAVAVLVVDNEPDAALFGMTGTLDTVLPSLVQSARDSGHEIVLPPSALISQKDGASLRAYGPTSTAGFELHTEEAATDSVPAAMQQVQLDEIVKYFFSQQFGCQGGDCLKYVHDNMVLTISQAPRPETGPGSVPTSSTTPSTIHTPPSPTDDPKEGSDTSETIHR